MTILGTRLDRRLALLLLAMIATAVAIAGVHIVRERRVANVLAVVDITGSMNTRDMGSGGAASGKDAEISRLAAVKNALVELIQNVPCQSRLGLGIFSERISFLLLDPVEVCGNHDALQNAIQSLDWRMAWAGDSYVAKGLYSAIEIASSLNSDLVMLTDGHEAPPLPSSGAPDFEGKPGAVRGLVVGVGSTEPSPIPKYDTDGRQIGVYQEQDVPQENRIGAPPKGAEFREGYNARNAPFGAMPAGGEEHLTSVKTAHLKTIATKTGLSYVQLKDNPSLYGPLFEATAPRLAPVNTNMSYVPALIALAGLLALYALSFLDDARLSPGNRHTK